MFKINNANSNYNFFQSGNTAIFLVCNSDHGLAYIDMFLSQHADLNAVNEVALPMDLNVKI